MSHDQVIQKLLTEITPNVGFDGWSDAAFDAAVRASGIDPVVARAACPRGAIDLAVAAHQAADAAMFEKLAQMDLETLKIRERITLAVRTRLEVIEDKEAVRRAATLFALPHHAPEGARLVWETCDQIWTALGDPSRDINWYSKRATLAAVYSAVLLFWFGDESDGAADSWAFLDRRIDNVMQFEGVKAKLKENPLFARFWAGPSWALGKVQAPDPNWRTGMPGRWGQG